MFLHVVNNTEFVFSTLSETLDFMCPVCATVADSTGAYNSIGCNTNEYKNRFLIRSITELHNSDLVEGRILF